MPTGFLNANRMPLRSHELVLVFYQRLPKYNPQFTEGKPYTQRRGRNSELYGQHERTETINTGNRYPTSLLYFKHDKQRFHPTQKPVALFEYLIKTYTNEGDLVLDNCAGSGTTGIASRNTNRDFILIEQDKEYCEIIKERLAR